MSEVQEAVSIEVARRRSPPAVAVRELRKEFKLHATAKKGRFDRRTRIALEDVSFTIERGETVAILGQNGSGKSTLVRLLSTLLLPDGGSAEIFGNDVVRDARPVRRLVNRVSVEASFFKKMSAAENLSYAARYYGMTAGQTRGHIPRSSAASASRATAATSRWRTSRAGCSRRWRSRGRRSTSPVVLLLDEPTTGLDPRSKLEVQDFIREIRSNHDSTILLCTHDLAEAEALAERVGILDRGRLLVLESADALKSRYGADTLEEAFFAATGREFEAEEDEDDDREVMA